MAPFQYEILYLSLLAALGMMSLVMLLTAAWAKWSRGEVLPWRPRRPVPWGPIGFLLICLMVGQRVFVVLTEGAETLFADQTAEEYVQNALTLSLMLLGVTAFGFFLLRVVSRACWSDMGWPESWSDIATEVVLGVLAFFAAWGPVILIQIVLALLFDAQTQHPLLKELAEDPNPAVIAVSILSAVIVAPIFEEFLFRLVLQGWLEKMLCERPTPIAPVPTAEIMVPPSEPHAFIPAGESELNAEGDNPYRAPQAILLGNAAEAPAVDAPLRPGRAAIAIGLSSLLFALAHVGHGPDPIPLFLLAVFLGYLYQRTHRILPCIVLHMLFNSCSLIFLALQTLAQEPAV